MFRKTVSAFLMAATLATAGLGLSATGAAAAGSTPAIALQGTSLVQEVQHRGRHDWRRGDDRRWSHGRDHDRRGDHGRRHGGGHGGWQGGPVQVCQPVITRQPVWRWGRFQGYQNVQTMDCRWSPRR